jgi:hypothetical protein
MKQENLVPESCLTLLCAFVFYATNYVWVRPVQIRPGPLFTVEFPGPARSRLEPYSQARGVSALDIIGECLQ